MSNMDKNTKIVSFTDLNSWQEGHKFVLMVYGVTKKFPKEELFCLTNQIRRASISITSNIAEGFSRPSYKDKTYLYTVSLGSLTETQNQLILSKDLGYVPIKDFNNLFEQSVVTSKLINGLIKKSRTYYTPIHNS